jgi:hypothetical protein
LEGIGNLIIPSRAGFNSINSVTDIAYVIAGMNAVTAALSYRRERAGRFWPMVYASGNAIPGLVERFATAISSESRCDDLSRLARREC